MTSAGPMGASTDIKNWARRACIPPHAELAQYLLMKVVADSSKGKYRTTLGMDLTGCYATLWES